MAWKKSNDGGWDYDVSQEIKKEEKPFNPFGSAHTVTFNLNMEEVPAPKSRKQQIQDRINAMRKTKYKYM